MKKRIIFSAGGTGGHLFPAQTVARALENSAKTLFVGGGLSKNLFFDRTQFEFVEIKTSSINAKKLFPACFKILRGFFQSRRIIKKYRPDVVVAFGSFYTFPLLLAAVSKKVPIILHEQNALPGKVNRLFSKWAAVTGITFDETKKYLKGKCEKVAFPLRFPLNKKEKNESLEYFGLVCNKITLLAFGGSQGGIGINRLMKELSPLLSQKIQILHFTGKKEGSENFAKLYSSLGLTFCVKEFEKNMDEAWNAADMALTRAGASTITEAINWSVPAVLIPFPFASENHQENNAEHFVKEAKGGFMFIEKEAKAENINKALESLMSGDFKKNLIRYSQERKLPKFEDLIIGEIK